MSVQQSKDLVSRASRLLIIQRSRIKRYRPAQELRGESPFFVFGEGLERFKKLGSLPAHTFRLAAFAGSPPVQQTPRLFWSDRGPNDFHRCLLRVCYHSPFGRLARHFCNRNPPTNIVSMPLE